MNRDTRVAVCCYAGDQQQVEQSLDLYLHHQCPVVILSPEDAKAEIRHLGVDNRFAGKRAQYGPDAHARYLSHLKILLDFEENYFLMHESDSVCLDVKIPDYLYEQPDIVWSNGGPAMPYNAAKFPDDCPALSFQAPWFLSRKTIERLIAAAHLVSIPIPSDGDLNGARDWWVDLYLCQLTYAAKLSYDFFRDRYLGPISGRYDDESATFFDPMPTNDPRTGYFLDVNEKRKPYNDHLVTTYADGLKNALEHVRSGACMIHSVKNPIAARKLLVEYQNRVSAGAT